MTAPDTKLVSLHTMGGSEPLTLFYRLARTHSGVEVIRADAIGYGIRIARCDAMRDSIDMVVRVRCARENPAEDMIAPETWANYATAFWNEVRRKVSTMDGDGNGYYFGKAGPDRLSLLRAYTVSIDTDDGPDAQNGARAAVLSAARTMASDLATLLGAETPVSSDTLESAARLLARDALQQYDMRWSTDMADGVEVGEVIDHDEDMGQDEAAGDAPGAIDIDAMLTPDENDKHPTAETDDVPAPSTSTNGTPEDQENADDEHATNEGDKVGTSPEVQPVHPDDADSSPNGPDVDEPGDALKDVD